MYLVDVNLNPQTYRFCQRSEGQRADYKLGFGSLTGLNIAWQAITVSTIYIGRLTCT
jgi:hypothetical protein